MSIRIDKKITGYGVVEPGSAPKARTPADAEAAGAEVIHMHEKVERPDTLIGATYKIKSPLFEHALYVTVNDIVLNAGTPHEQRRPFEIFINSKNMEHFQWIVALTRIMSAVFRKGGDVTFLVEELKAVFDPRGGYFKAGGVYMPSIVAELGAVIEQHMKMIGLIRDPEMSAEQRAMIAEKRAAYEARSDAAGAKKKAEISSDLAGAGAPGARKSPRAAGEEDAATATSAPGSATDTGFPAGASLCSKCNTSAMILMDGCETCLSCGYSKCG
jgi:hypothetical protein